MNDYHYRELLQNIAHRAMLEQGLLPDFSAQAFAELAQIDGPATMMSKTARGLTDLLWAKLVNGSEGIDIGNRARVQLTSVDVERGYIDFKRVGLLAHSPHDKPRPRGIPSVGPVVPVAANESPRRFGREGRLTRPR